jgi:hypothetical protein
MIKDALIVAPARRSDSFSKRQLSRFEIGKQNSGEEQKQIAASADFVRCSDWLKQHCRYCIRLLAKLKRSSNFNSFLVIFLLSAKLDSDQTRTILEQWHSYLSCIGQEAAAIRNLERSFFIRVPEIQLSGHPVPGYTSGRLHRYMH